LNGLLRRAALAVDSHCWHAVGQFRGKYSIPGDLERLLSYLIDTPEDHIFDGAWIDTGAIYEHVQHLSAQIGRVPVC
jgi:hypothetical protein